MPYLTVVYRINIVWVEHYFHKKLLSMQAKMEEICYSACMHTFYIMTATNKINISLNS